MEQRMQVKEANMQDLLDFANSDENIEVYNNEADIAELKNYMQFMKNSDMDVSRKNRSILVAIMKYLSNNMTNDAAANALSEIELDDPAQQKMAYQIAKKYLSGNVDIKQPKAKKDLYGKEKSEGVTFESYAQRMDMIAEGTWALPESEAEAMKIAEMMANPIALGDGGEDALNALGGLIGDDELWDDIGVAGDKDPEGDARPIIIGWLMDHVDDYGQKFQETMKMALDKIRADGNDSEMVIPRMFGNPRNTSATQGERMGSNADDMKEGFAVGANVAPSEEGPDQAPGKVIAVDGDKITVKFMDGSTEVFAQDELFALPAGLKFGEEVEEGRMSDIHQDIQEMIADGASNEEIKKEIPMATDSVIADIRKDMNETVEEVQEVDEAADMIAKMAAMAGVGSGAKSNHGIHEGEAGYQLTPRSIVAREMRKLQDIERNS